MFIKYNIVEAGLEVESITVFSEKESISQWELEMVITNEQKCRHELIKTVLTMKNGTMDILMGLRRIHGLWPDTGFNKDDTYNKLKYIESETEDVKKGNERKYFFKDTFKIRII